MSKLAGTNNVNKKQNDVRKKTTTQNNEFMQKKKVKDKIILGRRGLIRK